MSQSSNDSFPSAMNIAAAVNVKEQLIPAVTALRDAIAAKAEEWKDVVKIGRTHMQDATFPLTYGQEWSGYVGVLTDNLDRIEYALERSVSPRAGRHSRWHWHQCRTGIRGKRPPAEIAKLTKLPFVSCTQQVRGAGVRTMIWWRSSGTLRTLAVSLYKIANDIRLMSCGPRAGFLPS